MHKAVFFGLVVIFYGVIFARIEHWPFSDWRVFEFTYHPDRVYVFSLEIESQNSRNILNEVGVSPVSFNVTTYRAYAKEDFNEVNKIINSIKELPKFKALLEKEKCPCRLNLIINKVKSHSKNHFELEKVNAKSYEVF